MRWWICCRDVVGRRILGEEGVEVDGREGRRV